MSNCIIKVRGILFFISSNVKLRWPATSEHSTGLKGTRYKSRFGGFKTDIIHDRVLGISVNIPDLRQISHMTVY